MNTTPTILIENSAAALHPEWDAVAGNNIFLSRQYLAALEESAPENMRCYFIGIIKENDLIGVAIAQLLQLHDVKSFGERDNCLKTKIRSFAFKKFGTNVLLLGNNMLTGQNAYNFLPQITDQDIASLLAAAFDSLEKSLGKKATAAHIAIWKDFAKDEAEKFEDSKFRNYFRFSTQPNMVFAIPPSWKAEPDYISMLQKKYRDQFKRARKKSAGIERRMLSADEISQLNGELHSLYMEVAKNAPFNTFYLHPLHFASMKSKLGDAFVVFGYFDGEKMVSFCSLIINGKDIDTYFLGYSEQYQKEKMLYLNMLYDMLLYAISHGFKKIIFARTALEIKSSVGARAITMYGLIKHRNPLLNKLMSRIFGYFEPKVSWIERHPFREEEQQPSSASE